jgi:hypothetical protein
LSLPSFIELGSGRRDREGGSSEPATPTDALSPGEQKRQPCAENLAISWGGGRGQTSSGHQKWGLMALELRPRQGINLGGRPWLRGMVNDHPRGKSARLGAHACWVGGWGGQETLNPQPHPRTVGWRAPIVPGRPIR